LDNGQRNYALITWRKAGPLRYLSHLEVARTFDRAVRRARLPVVYSKGFSPKASISFPDALPVGVAAENELCLLELQRAMPARAIADMLASQMPQGLDIIEAHILRRRRGKLFSELSRAEYRIELVPIAGVSVGTLQEAIRRVRQAGTLTIVRETRTRTRDIDIKPHTYALRLTTPDAEHTGVGLEMSLGYGHDQLVKPSEVLSCIAQQLTELTGKQIVLQPRLITRLGLY